MAFHKHFSTLKSAVLAAFAFVCGSAAATDYYWIGGDSAEWANGSNWSLTSGGEAANAYPGASDVATFGGNASITMSAGVSASNITISAGVRVQFSSSDYKVLQVSVVTADATSTLALSNVIVIPAVHNAPISGQIELIAGTTNGLYGASGRDLQVNGNLTGSGEVYFRNYASKGSRGGVCLNGDNSQFSGVAHILMAEGLDMSGSHGYATTFKWTTLASGSANARWIVEGSDSTNGPKFPLATLTSAENPFKLGTLEGSKNVAGGQNAVFYLEIGNALDFEYGGTIIRGSSSNGTKLTKVGAGTMTFSGKLDDKSTTSSITIKEGAVKFSGASSLPAAGIVMSGGELKVGVADGVKVDPSAKISTSSTAAVVYDDEGDDSVWASLGAVTKGLVKKGTGSLTIKSASYTGDTVVEAGRLNLPAGMTIASLDVKDGAALGLYSTEAYSEPTAVFTITSVSSGVNLATAIPNTATHTFSFEVDEGTGVVTVKAVRSACVFTWTGLADASWENVANWQVGGQAVTELPTPIDTVLFPAKAEGGWDVTVALDTHIVAMTNNAPVTLMGEGDIYLGAIGSDLVEAPALTLGDNATIRSENARGAVLKIDVPLNITASDEHPANVWGRWMRDSDGNASLYLNRELTGAGAVVMAQSRGGIFFNGTNTAFTGSVTIRDDSSSSVSGGLRTSPEFVLPDATGSNAVWTIYNSGSLLKGNGKTYYFGSLSGTISLNSTQSNYKNNTLEIGARDDVDSNLAGNFFANSYINLVESRGNAIRKVGASTLTVSASRVKAFEINGGTVIVANNRSIRGLWTGEKTEVDDPELDGVTAYYATIQFGGGVLALTDEVTADPSYGIANSSAPITISNATARVFAAPLASSNVGGLVKKGTGTLTLAATEEQTLGYSGYTRVEAGKLVIPAGTHYKWDILSPVALVAAVDGAAPTGFGIGTIDTTWVYGENEWSDVSKTVDLSNLAKIDLTSVTEIAKGQKFVIMTAKAFQVNGAAMTKAQREAIEVVLADEVKAYAEAKGYSLKIEGNNLVYGPKTGIVIVIK